MHIAGDVDVNRDVSISGGISGTFHLPSGNVNVGGYQTIGDDLDVGGSIYADFSISGSGLNFSSDKQYDFMGRALEKQFPLLVEKMHDRLTLAILKKEPQCLSP